MKQPNLLIMMCDQLTATALSCYGSPFPTPNLDRLASRGVRFTNAVCPTPYCSPSRATLITGTYPHTHGIIHNVNIRDYPAIPTPPTEEGIRKEDLTTEKILHQAGYQTHHYGKWHLLEDDLDYYPDMFTEHGAYEETMQERFMEVQKRPRESWMNWYNWSLPVTQSPAYTPIARRMDQEKLLQPYTDFVSKIGRLDLPLEEWFDPMVAGKTIAALRTLDDRPFMITCSFNAPHDPNVVPSPYYERIDPEQIPLPGNVRAREPRYENQLSSNITAAAGETGTKEIQRVYYANVQMIDDLVGKVMAELEATGRLEDTIILFMSDHGDMCGGHGMVWKSTDAFYDEIARIPLFLSFPQRLEPGVCDIPCSVADIMPTLLELTGMPVPAGLDGTSLLPYLVGEADPDQAPSYVFCERFPINPRHSRQVENLRQGDFMIRGRAWKYIRYHDGDEMLYDLGSDPGETTNLAANPDFQVIKADIQQRLESWLKKAEKDR